MPSSVSIEWPLRKHPAQVFVEQRHREAGIPMGWAVDHALFDELGSGWGDGTCASRKDSANVPRPMRPRADFGKAEQPLRMRSKTMAAA